MGSQVDVLIRAADAGCQLVDVELQTAIRLKPAQIEKLRAKAALVLSFHDFRATQKLDETLKGIIEYARNARQDVQRELINFEEILEDNFRKVEFMPGSKEISKRRALSSNSGQSLAIRIALGPPSRR